MKILFLSSHSSIRGLLPKLSPILIAQLRNLGCLVETSLWSAHNDKEFLLQKILQRTKDIQIIKQKIISFYPDLMLVTTTHDWKAILRDLPLLITVRKLCPKIVLHLHGSFSNRLVSSGSLLLKLFTRIILDHCGSVFLFSNEEIREWTLFYPNMHYYWVDNPYIKQNSEINKEKNTQTPVILFIGRLIEEKGIFDLLEAVKILKDSYQFKVLIAGDGPDREKLKSAVKACKINSHVSLLGYLSGKDLKEAYESALIFVLPSWREGFPLVLVEAMDFGLPIVTTRIRGAVDRLTEGKNCLFIEPKNPRELVNALERLLNDPGLREKMGRNNKEKVKEYIPDMIGKKYYEILNKIVNQ